MAWPGIAGQGVDWSVVVVREMMMSPAIRNGLDWCIVALCGLIVLLIVAAIAFLAKSWRDLDLDTKIGITSVLVIAIVPGFAFLAGYLSTFVR